MRQATFLISILLAIASLSSCTNANNKSHTSTDTITGVRGKLVLLHRGETFECPNEAINNETVFYVNTLKYYHFRVRPIVSSTNNEVIDIGDNVVFDDEWSTYSYNETTMHSTRYGDFYYDKDADCYIAHFTKIGTFDLNFTYKEFKSIIKFVCDNESDKYDKYRADMPDIFPWAKNLSLDDVDKVRLQQGGIGVAPGSFDFVKYTTDRNDISNVYNLLLSKVMISETNAHQITGGGFNTITFFSGENKYDMKIYNGFTSGDDSLSSNFAYHIEKIPGTTRIDNPYQECYSFITYGTDDCYAYRSEEDTDGVLVNYLDKLEFVKWGDNPMDDNMPEFYIDDGLKLSSKLYIYAADRFKYEDVFYRVIGDVNFSNLFEQA
jgi:hypothetical protein